MVLINIIKYYVLRYYAKYMLYKVTMAHEDAPISSEFLIQTTEFKFDHSVVGIIYCLVISNRRQISLSVHKNSKR